MSVDYSPNLLAESMIIRGIKKKKMGQSFSKRKPKEKKESLLSQMRDVTEVDPVPSRSPPSPPGPPSPPPRGLLTTLGSPTLTQEFIVFLQQLDLATRGGADDSGLGEDDEEVDRASTLRFVLDVRMLEEVVTEKEKMDIIRDIGVRYFPVGQRGRGLVLDNNQLWNRCSEACHSVVLSKQGLEDLRLAHDSCLPELDDLHLLFLHQREEQSCVKQIISCLL